MNEIIVLIQLVVYIFNERNVLIQRIIYIFNEEIFSFNKLFTHLTKEWFSFNELFKYLTDELFLFNKLFIYSTNYLCIQKWTNNSLNVRRFSNFLCSFQNLRTANLVLRFSTRVLKPARKFLHKNILLWRPKILVRKVSIIR